MDPNQLNLEGLLKFAIQAGSHGETPQQMSGRNLSAEEKTWLNEAITNATTGGVNVIDELKNSLDRISKFLDSEAPSDDEIENCLNQLENISEWCENQDIANDFGKIDGFSVIFRCFKHKDPEVRWRAVDIIGTSAQNNEYNQQVLLDNNGLKVAMEMTDNNNEDSQVRVKSFFAVSCIVRSSATNMNYFERNNGFDIVVRALQSGIKKLELKAIFFTRSLCMDDSKLIPLLAKHGLPEQLVRMITQFSETPLQDDSLDLLENVLSTLHTMATSSNEVKLNCNKHSLVKSLQTIKQDLIKNHHEHLECIEFATAICKLLPEEDDVTDR